MRTPSGVREQESLDRREPDPAFWVIVLGGVSVALVLFGLALDVVRTAVNFERTYYPTTGGYGIYVAIEATCLAAIGVVVAVLVALYGARHRPLHP